MILPVWQQRLASPLIVYQMGKVASTSIYWTLKRRLPDAEVLGAHLLTDSYLAEMETWLRQDGWDAEWRKTLLEYLDGSRKLGVRLAQPDLPVTVVTATRDPLGQAISAFFQHAEAYGALLWGPDATTDERVLRLLDYFGSETRRWCHGASGVGLVSTVARFLFDIPLRWFEDELKATFDVDVYSSPFPHERGYKIISSARADVLVLRFEDLHRTAAAAFYEFLGLTDFELDSENVSEAKESGVLMRSLLARIRISPEVAAHAYSTRYARHFYTRAERERFARRWTGEEIQLPE